MEICRHSFRTAFAILLILVKRVQVVGRKDNNGNICTIPLNGSVDDIVRLEWFDIKKKFKQFFSSSSRVPFSMKMT